MSLAPELRVQRLADFFGAQVPCVVFARNSAFPGVTNWPKVLDPVLRGRW